ncbi:MAG TPA: TolC family protein [Defluviitoga sp.]|nr:TolC family protein [Defluviitoga sp.]HOP24731.1 TolC family protein [Defluviitoga sp.]HPZ28300.1 TolC family protein [Defluviitoga sp.]HQD62190.1 TolC family protein [Defluviitoga sp.]
MKKSVLLLITLLMVVISFSVSLVDVFEIAKEKSNIYKIAQIDLEKTLLDYDKTMIEAINKKIELAGELAYQKGLMDYNNSIKEYYADILSRVFNLYLQEINVNIVTLQLKSAQINYDNSKELYNRGLISDDDLKIAELDVKDVENYLKNSQISLETAQDNLKKVYDGDIREITIVVPTLDGLFVSDEEYLNKSYALKLAKLNAALSEYDLNNLPSNASIYTKKITEATHQKNLLTLEDTEDKLLEAHKIIINSLEILDRTLQNLQERVKLSQKTFNDTKNRFDKGLVSELELNVANINYLNSQKTYYESLQNYLKTYINYVVDTGRSLKEVGL